MFSDFDAAWWSSLDESMASLPTGGDNDDKQYLIIPVQNPEVNNVFHIHLNAIFWPFLLIFTW